MPKENLKKSSQHRFLLYAVIWGIWAGVLFYPTSVVAQEAAPLSADETITALGDPFDPKTRAPGLWKFFLDGVARLQAEAEARKAKPVVVRPVELPKVPEIVVPPTELPATVVTGIVYNTDRPQAIMNGVVVEQGDVLANGVKVVSIHKGGVDVRFEDIKQTLKFNNE